MICPKCNTQNYCPCSNCSSREKDKLPKWKWRDGEFISCGNCGFEQHCNLWEKEVNLTMFFEQKEKLAELFEEWAQKEEGVTICVNPFNVITFLQDKKLLDEKAVLKLLNEGV